MAKNNGKKDSGRQGKKDDSARGSVAMPGEGTETSVLELDAEDEVLPEAPGKVKEESKKSDSERRFASKNADKFDTAGEKIAAEAKAEADKLAKEEEIRLAKIEEERRAKVETERSEAIEKGLEEAKKGATGPLEQQIASLRSECSTQTTRALTAEKLAEQNETKAGEEAEKHKATKNKVAELAAKNAKLTRNMWFVIIGAIILLVGVWLMWPSKDTAPVAGQAAPSVSSEELQLRRELAKSLKENKAAQERLEGKK